MVKQNGSREPYLGTEFIVKFEVRITVEDLDGIIVIL